MSMNALSRVLIAMLCALFLQGCGFLAPVFGPVYQTSTSSVDQAEDIGFIRFTNLTSDHRIFVDGTSVGSGNEFDAERVLAVSPGAHLVEILEGGNRVFHRKVFIGTGSTRNVALQ